MGQTTSAEEQRMNDRIQKSIGSYAQFAQNLEEANDWAKLCPKPKLCRLQFRVVVNQRVPPEFLPYVWKMADNVQVEVRKVRREYESVMLGFGDKIIEPDVTEDDTVHIIGHAKILSAHQFYHLFCLLSDIRDCAAHCLSFPMSLDQAEKDTIVSDEMECQICMDKHKEVVLPCTHSFCLSCYKNWSSLNQTCPTCRSIIKCSDGEELWQLTFNEANDMQSYASDLVSRIYEFFDKMPKSECTEEDITRSKGDFSVAILALKQHLMDSAASMHQQDDDSTINNSTDHEPDYLFALQLASNDDQYEAEKQVRELCRDKIIAQALATEFNSQ